MTTLPMPSGLLLDTEKLAASQYIDTFINIGNLYIFKGKYYKLLDFGFSISFVI